MKLYRKYASANVIINGHTFGIDKGFVADFMNKCGDVVYLCIDYDGELWLHASDPKMNHETGTWESSSSMFIDDVVEEWEMPEEWQNCLAVLPTRRLMLIKAK